MIKPQPLEGDNHSGRPDHLDALHSARLKATHEALGTINHRPDLGRTVHTAGKYLPDFATYDAHGARPTACPDGAGRDGTTGPVHDKGVGPVTAPVDGGSGGAGPHHDRLPHRPDSGTEAPHDGDPRHHHMMHKPEHHHKNGHGHHKKHGHEHHHYHHLHKKHHKHHLVPKQAGEGSGNENGAGHSGSAPGSQSGDGGGGVLPGKGEGSCTLGPNVTHDVPAAPLAPDVPTHPEVPPVVPAAPEGPIIMPEFHLKPVPLTMA